MSYVLTIASTHSYIIRNGSIFTHLKQKKVKKMLFGAENGLLGFRNRVCPISRTAREIRESRFPNRGD